MTRTGWTLAGLRLLLAVLVAGNVFELCLGLGRQADLVGQFPRLLPLRPVYLASPVVPLIGLGATWRRQRWGCRVGLGIGAVVCSIGLYASGQAAHVFRVPVAMAFVFALALNPGYSSIRRRTDHLQPHHPECRP